MLICVCLRILASSRIPDMILGDKTLISEMVLSHRATADFPGENSRKVTGALRWFNGCYFASTRELNELHANFALDSGKTAPHFQAQHFCLHDLVVVAYKRIPCKCPDGHMLISSKGKRIQPKIWPCAALRDGQVLCARAPCCWCWPWSPWALMGWGRGCGGGTVQAVRRSLLSWRPGPSCCTHDANTDANTERGSCCPQEPPC
jgi:hypothetical protein